MEYDVWACIDGGDPVRITVTSGLGGKSGATEFLKLAAVVWEALVLRGATVRNSHPLTGQSADEWSTNH